MSGSFREYNWVDIMRLVLEDAGLKTDEDQRSRGDVRIMGNINPPSHEKDTCIRVHVYDKPFGERIKEHAGEK